MIRDSLDDCQNAFSALANQAMCCDSHRLPVGDKMTHPKCNIAAIDPDVEESYYLN